MIENLTILENCALAKDVYRMTLKTSSMAKLAKPGQFINISLGDKEHLLRRPISISQIDGDNLIIIYKVLGVGTKILSEMKTLEKLNVLGPLGNGFPLEEGKALIIGGGIGTAPLYELARQINGEKLIVLGFRNSAEVFYAEEFSKLGTVVITTDDGSYGYHGNPIQYLHDNPFSANVFYACGPAPLLKGVEMEYANAHGYLSYEERMACGVGLCHGCVKGEPHRCVCTDGPVFKVGELYGSKC